MDGRGHGGGLAGGRGRVRRKKASRWPGPPPRRQPRRRRRPRRRVPRPPAPPEPVAEPTIVPPEPVREDAIASASLDDINRNSPLKPLFFEYDSSEISTEGQAVLDANAATLQTFPYLDRHHRRPLRRARHGRVQSGIGRTTSGGGAGAPGIARHLRRPDPDRELRQGISVRCGARRGLRTRRTGARISSSPRSETAMRSSTGALPGLHLGARPVAGAPGRGARQRASADCGRRQDAAGDAAGTGAAGADPARSARRNTEDRQSAAGRPGQGQPQGVRRSEARHRRAAAGSRRPAREGRRLEYAPRIGFAGSGGAATGAPAGAPGRGPGGRAAPIRPTRRRLRAAPRTATRSPAGAPGGAAPVAVGTSPNRLTTWRIRTTRPACGISRSTDSRRSSARSRNRIWPTTRRSTSATRICRTARTTRRSKPTISRFARIANGNAIPEAYYKKGLALKNLKQIDLARQAWEYVVKTYDQSTAALLANSNFSS